MTSGLGREGGTVQFRQRGKGKIKSRGLKFIAPTAETPDAIIDDLESIHGRSKFFALTSGGKDSMGVCHWLAERGKLEAAVHIKTNVGVRETSDWLEGYCRDVGWKLYVIQPKPKYTYASFVLEYGFPGPMAHKMIMGLLKYKTMRDFALTIDRYNHCLISGVRRFESQRRMGNYPHPIQHDGNLWFACPFFYMHTEEVYKYVLTHGIKITPVHQKLGMSGECMCGAYATRGEKALLRELDPELAGYIEWLEDGVSRFGTPEAKRHPTWGGSMRMSEMEQQKMLDSFFGARPDLRDVEQMQYGICGEECGVGTSAGRKIIRDYARSHSLAALGGPGPFGPDTPAPGPPAGSPPAELWRPGLCAPGGRHSAPALRPSNSRMMSVHA